MNGNFNENPNSKSNLKLIFIMLLVVITIAFVYLSEGKTSENFKTRKGGYRCKDKKNIKFIKREPKIQFEVRDEDMKKKLDKFNETIYQINSYCRILLFSVP